jgi:hypothetical protein
VKQDRMIPVFRCMVVETLVAPYCEMFSAAGVKRYIRFRELRPLEAWECRQARLNGQVFIYGKAIVGKIGATVSHTIFLTGGLDDESRCEVGVVTLPDGRVLNGQVAQGAVRDHPPGRVCPTERVDRQLDSDLRCAGGGRRQEPSGQS